MRIRWKLLILLLIISLGPTGISLWIGQEAARHLGEKLAAGTRERLINDAKQNLLQIVRDHGKLLQRGAKMLAHNVRIQAQAAERCLAADPPADPVIHRASEFEEGGEVGNLTISPCHARVASDDSMSPMPVSFEQQSFLLAPGVESEDTAEDMARLSGMLPTYCLIYESQSEFLHWQYTALESGLHSAYPGHGYYPKTFDPRQRVWYTTAVLKGELTWCPPIVDASTQQVILTRSMPIHGPDGSLAGVTAIDVRMTDLVKEVQLPAAWASAARSMLVSPMPQEGVGGVYIIAQSVFESARTWDVPITPPRLTSPDAELLAEVVADLWNERAGVRELSFEGRPSLWAYSPLAGTGTSLLTVVARDHVARPALEAEKQVLIEVLVFRNMMLLVIGGILVVSVILALSCSRSVTKPISELAAVAGRIAEGDLETTADIRSRDELGELGRAFNAMLPQLRDRLKLRQSLALAVEVQQHLLPGEPPVLEGLDIAGRSIYCDETGGDYYDFIDLERLGRGTLGVAVGDVSGHGIAAALLMASARSLLRCCAEESRDLGQVLNQLNRRISGDVPTDKFMTLSFMLIDSQAKTVRWTGAGHDPAVVYDPRSDTFEEFVGGGIPLGIDSTWSYKENGPRPLKSGEVIVIGTDGIWEARDTRKSMFGKPRFLDAIRSAASGSAHDISDAVTRAVASFRGEHTQDDDITLVVVKVL